MKTLFEKMRANRGRCVAHSVQEPASEVPFMVVDGEKYVQTPQDDSCKGCAFESSSTLCDKAYPIATQVFGVGCWLGNVIYIRAQ